MNKKQLYESIMRNVAKEVKEELNLIDFGNNKIQKTNEIEIPIDLQIEKMVTYYNNILQKEWRDLQEYYKTWDLKNTDIREYISSNGYTICRKDEKVSLDHTYYMVYNFIGPSKLFEYAINFDNNEIQSNIQYHMVDISYINISNINEFKDHYKSTIQYYMEDDEDNNYDINSFKLKCVKTYFDQINDCKYFMIYNEVGKPVVNDKFTSFEETKKIAYKLAMEEIKKGMHLEDDPIPRRFKKYFDLRPIDISRFEPYSLATYRYYNYDNPYTHEKFQKYYQIIGFIK